MRIMLRDLFRCRECGRFEPPRFRNWQLQVWDEWQMGHLIPVAQGGRNWRNIALICRECNQRIGAKVWKPKVKLRWWQKVLDWFLVIWFGDWPRKADLRGHGG